MRTLRWKRFYAGLLASDGPFEYEIWRDTYVPHTFDVYRLVTGRTRGKIVCRNKPLDVAKRLAERQHILDRAAEKR